MTEDKKSNYDYLSEEWERAVVASFPFTTNGCTFNLESISDFDTDGAEYIDLGKDEAPSDFE